MLRRTLFLAAAVVPLVAACAPSLDHLELVEPSRPDGAPAPVPPEVWIADPPSTGAGDPATPEFAPYDRRPVLENGSDVERALRKLYPPLLKRERIGGRVLLWLWVDEYGIVQEARIDEPSGHTELDFTAVRIARIMRFEPAARDGEPLPVWIRIPMTFESR